MKKIFSALFLTLGAVAASAQTNTEGYVFSENNYVGTAHSLGLGNAVMAVGGDLGTIGINPAGSAVSKYSQFTFTAGYASPANGAGESGLTVPNIGGTVYFDLSYMQGALKSVTMGFVMNCTNDFRFINNCSYRNGSASKFAEMASASCGIPGADFEAADAYRSDALSYYWDAVMGYNLEQINPFGVHNEYIGITERLNEDGTHGVADDLYQTSRIRRRGRKDDLLFNIAANFDDKWYFGLNIGMVSVSYSNTELINEEAVNKDNFPVKLTYQTATGPKELVKYFSDASYQFAQTVDMSGVYAKIGFIGLPVAGLRVAASYQTRTLFDNTEQWRHSGDISYMGERTRNGSSELGTYNYQYYAPSVLSLGAAYTFSHIGMISVDYDRTDYTRMSFANASDSYYLDDSYFDQNRDIEENGGQANTFRIGLEANVSPMFAVRGGYAFTDYPENFYYGKVRGFSLGAGFKSYGSFFADAAVRLTQYPAFTFCHYDDYYTYNFDEAADEFVPGELHYAPRIEITRNLLQAIVTVGWRF